MKYNFKIICTILLFLTVSLTISSQELLKAIDIFDLKYVSDVKISPNGNKIAYLVNSKDILTDKNYSNLWIINSDGSNNQKISNGNFNEGGVSWSNKGESLAYKSNKKGNPKIFIRDVNNQIEKSITNTKEYPGAIAWSPDDKSIAFNMFVPKPKKTFFELPKKPSNSKWNKPPVYIDILPYRSDGSGYIKSGNKQLFVININDGKLLQITNDTFNHGSPQWHPDGKNLISYGLINGKVTDSPSNTDIYRVDIKNKKLSLLTDRKGRDETPKVSKDGKWIAYIGNDENKYFYQAMHLYLMDLNGNEKRRLELPKNFDRSIRSFEWSADNKGLYIFYENQGMLQLSFLDLFGSLTPLVKNIGGDYILLPYTDVGGFSISNKGSYAYNYGSSTRPPEVGIGKDGINIKLTNINDSLFSSKKTSEIEEIWIKSNHDQLDIQGWVVKPPNFDPNKKYPLILQIHGGPHLSYGPYFSLYNQVYAAEGYVVLYINPRGSTGYGEKFSQEINFQFPSNDYYDLMTAVSKMTQETYIDKNNLFVTGGSGGGVLSSWITSKSKQFRAACVVNPVINWYSFSLYTDNPQRWFKFFPDFPWNNPKHYQKYSPITYVNNVKTPTLLITGDSDYRTPIAEIEQYYTALKMLGTDTVMLRIPNSSHELDYFGSGTVAQLTAILAWFDKYKKKK